jgi:CheY-like chemotaxis protein
MLGLGAERELPTVLLIDDDMVSREVMATVLTMGGFTVFTAVDGASAVALVANGSCAPEVILMDARMPGLSGGALIAELRAHSRAAVIAISASQPSAEINANADGFLLKPFGAVELERFLEKHGTEPRAAVPQAKHDDPVVSAETLAQLRAMMPEAAVRKIFVAIVQDLDVRLRRLEKAIAEANAAEVQSIGHAIKGGCGMAGAMQAASIGARLEDEGRAASLSTMDGGNNLDNSSQLLKDLQAAALNLERMLEAEFPA